MHCTAAGTAARLLCQALQVHVLQDSGPQTLGPDTLQGGLLRLSPACRKLPAGRQRAGRGGQHSGAAPAGRLDGCPAGGHALRVAPGGRPGLDCGPEHQLPPAGAPDQSAQREHV